MHRNGERYAVRDTPVTARRRPERAAKAQASKRERVFVIISRPWGPRLLDELARGPARFNRIKAALPGISSKSLSSILRLFESEELVARKEIAQHPLAVQYSMTTKGRSLAELIARLRAWEREWARRAGE